MVRQTGILLQRFLKADRAECLAEPCEPWKYPLITAFVIFLSFFITETVPEGIILIPQQFSVIMINHNQSYSYNMLWVKYCLVDYGFCKEHYIQDLEKVCHYRRGDDHLQCNSVIIIILLLPRKSLCLECCLQYMVTIGDHALTLCSCSILAFQHLG